MSQITVYLSRENGDGHTQLLDLPATWYELEDAFHKARVGKEYVVRVHRTERRALAGCIRQPADLAELNILARRLEELTPEQCEIFEAFVEHDSLLQADLKISTARLIHITQGVVNSTLLCGAKYDHDLGSYLIDSGKLTPDAKRRYLKLDEAEKQNPRYWEAVGIGRRMQNHGVYVSRGYVELGPISTEEISLSGNIPAAFSKEEAPVVLEVTSGQNTVTLSLPPKSEQELSRHINSLGSSAQHPVTLRCIACRVPGAKALIDRDQDIFHAWSFAAAINYMERDGTLLAYKAAFEALIPQSLDDAITLTGEAEDFILDPKIVGPRMYAEAYLKPLDAPGLDLPSFCILPTLGRRLMELENIVSTPYGALRRENGEPIRAENRKSLQELT